MTGKLIQLADFSQRVAHQHIAQGRSIDDGTFDMTPDRFAEAHRLLEELSDESDEALDDLVDVIRIPLHQVHRAAQEAMDAMSLDELWLAKAAATRRLTDEGLTAEEEMVEQFLDNEISRRNLGPKGAA